MRLLGKTGLISETGRSSEELSFDWEIRDFLARSRRYGDYYESPDFDFCGNRWYLTVVPRGFPQMLFTRPSFCLERREEGPAVTVQCVVGIKSTGLAEVKEYMFSKKPSFVWFHFSEGRFSNFIVGRDGSLTVFCKIRRVLPNLAGGISSQQSTSVQREDKFQESCARTSGSQSSGKQGISSQQSTSVQRKDKFLESCARTSGSKQEASIQTEEQPKENADVKEENHSLQRQDASIQTEEQFKENAAVSEESHSLQRQGIEKVVEDIGKLLVSGQKSDITVEVKQIEVKQFKVHSIILSARSPVLSAMLEHDTAERASNKIRIDDCEPDVFQQYLQYLYTGSVQSLTAQTVFGLFTVADKYLADDLKLLCLEHIQNGLSVDTFCDTIKLALTHRLDDLLQLAIDFASKDIQSILISLEWQSFISEYPREANEILIKSLRQKR